MLLPFNRPIGAPADRISTSRVIPRSLPCRPAGHSIDRSELWYTFSMSRRWEEKGDGLTPDTPSRKFFFHTTTVYGQACAMCIRRTPSWRCLSSSDSASTFSIQTSHTQLPHSPPLLLLSSYTMQAFNANGGRDKLCWSSEDPRESLIFGPWGPFYRFTVKRLCTEVIISIDFSLI